MVMEQWRIRCREFGVDVMYKCGGGGGGGGSWWVRG